MLVYFLPGKKTLAEILDKAVGRQPDVVFVALAGLELGEERQPVWGCEVYRLGDIEAEIESFMVG